MEEEDQKEFVGCEPLSFALLQGDSSCLSGRTGRYIDFHRSHTRLHKCCIPIHGHHTPLKSLSGFAANHNNAAIHSYYACLQSLSVCFHSSVLPHLAISNLTHLFHHHSDPSTTQSDHRLSPKLSHSHAIQKSLSPPTSQPLFTSPAPESTIGPEALQHRFFPFSTEESKTYQEFEPFHTPHQEGNAISPAFASITFRGHALLPSITHRGHRPLYTQKNKEDTHEPF